MYIYLHTHTYKLILLKLIYVLLHIRMYIHGRCCYRANVAMEKKNVAMEKKNVATEICCRANVGSEHLWKQDLSVLPHHACILFIFFFFIIFFFFQFQSTIM